MNIDKYIDFGEIWEQEICLDTSIECLDDNIMNFTTIQIIQQFQNDDSVEFDFDECYTHEDKLIFMFSETGGQNESDTQGWSREYTFIVDSDFMVIDADYQQG